MPVSRGDRDSISSLQHPPPPNLRDASTRPLHKWETPAQPIAPPSNNYTHNRLLNGGFSMDRMRDSLHGNKSDPRAANRTKSRTLALSAPPSKRRKTRHLPPLANEGVHFIQSDEEEEDLGQAVAGPSSIQHRITPTSLPPKQRHSAPMNKPSLDQPQAVEISSDEDEIANGVDEERGPSDKPNPTWARNKPHGKGPSPSAVSRTSSIEDFSDDPPKAKPGANGFVKHQANVINNKAKKASVFPVVNLAKNQPSGGIKSGMKAKQQTLKIHLQKDPVATSSTPFTSTASKRRDTKEDTRIIPLEDAYFGFKRIGAGHHLEFKVHKGDRDFSIKGPEVNYTFTYAQDLNSCQLSLEPASPSNHDPICISFTTKPVPPGRQTQSNTNLGEDFQQGEPRRGQITLKIDRADPDFLSSRFTSFRTICTGALNRDGRTVGIVGNSGKALWEQAHRIAGMSPSPEPESFVEEDSLNIQDDEGWSGGGPFDTETNDLPISNERSRPPKEPNGRPKSKPISKYTTRKASSGPSESRAPSVGPRRSSRQQENQVKQRPSEDPDEIILSYPPIPTGAVNITNADFNRLQPGEYLNDTLIEFGLKLWHHELSETDPELAKQIHVFNSFFYKKLNKKNLEEAYQSVRRWTSKFDIFEKKFIIVPINENLHWYLAIIYQPEHVLLPPPEREVRNTRGHARSSNASEAKPLNDVVPPSPDVELRALEEETPASPVAETASEANADAGSSISRQRSASLEVHDGNSRAVSPSRAEDLGGSSPRPSSEADAESTQRMLDIDDADSAETTKGFPVTVTAELATTTDDYPTPNTTVDGSEDMDVDEEVQQAAPTTSTSTSLSFSALNTSPRDPRNHQQPMDLDALECRTQDLVVDEEAVEPRASSLSKTTAISPTNFYAPLSKKGKEKAFESPTDVVDADHAIDIPDVATVDQPTTYIFILDSLGGRHPRVASILSGYLQMEAKDKKSIENPSKAVGRPSAVPVQPNYCDCGIYLIHFARVFVKKAPFFCRLSALQQQHKKGNNRSSKERQEDWDGEELEDFRESLRAKVIALSKDWKRARLQQAQQEQNKEGENSNEGQPETTTVHDSSDSEIDIVETAPAQNLTKRGRAKRIR